MLVVDLDWMKLENGDGLPFAFHGRPGPSESISVLRFSTILISIQQFVLYNYYEFLHFSLYHPTVDTWLLPRGAGVNESPGFPYRVERGCTIRIETNKPTRI